VGRGGDSTTNGKKNWRSRELWTRNWRQHKKKTGMKEITQELKAG